MTRREDRTKTSLRLLSAAVALSALTACGGGGGGGGGGNDGTYTLGGLAAGVNGPGLVLRNGTESLSVPATGSFTFVTRLAQGAAYAVTVTGHPANQTCSATNASGTMGTANVTNIAVACVAAEPPPPPPPNTYTVGGEVIGMSGTGMVLTNNGGNDLAVTANGAFAFSTRIATGMPYAVAIATQPSGQTCTVANASGTVGSGNVSNIQVNCGASAPTVHTIGGTVTNLTATGLVLHNNGGDALTVPPGATSFSFAARVAHGGSYNVTVAVHPGTTRDNSQDCTVGSTGVGTAAGDVSNVTVTCGEMGPLTLLGSSPADAAIDVPRNVQPTLNFSRPVNPATVHNSFALNPTNVSNPTAVVSGAVVTLQPPVAKLLPATRYTASAFRATLRGMRGEFLTDTESRRFTTADNRWKEGHAVEGSQQTFNSAGPFSAVDDEGNAFVAWIDDSEEGVRVSRYSAATSTWSSPTLLTGQSGVTMDARVVVDGSGNAVVTWQHRNEAAYQVLWSARYDKDGGTWDSPQVITHTDGSSVTEFQVVVAAAPTGARVTAAWIRSNPGTWSEVWVAESTTTAGASWSTPRRIDDPAVPANMDELQLAGSGSNLRAAVWKARGSLSDGNPVIWAKVLRDESEPPARVISNNNGDPESRPQVDVRGSDVHVIWQQNARATTGREFSNIWMARFQSDAWQANRHVVGSGDQNYMGFWPALATCGSSCTSAANAHVWISWVSADGVWVMQVPDAGPLVPRRLLHFTSDLERYLYTAALRLDAAGNVLKLWTALDADSQRIIVKSARLVASTGTWGETVTLTSAAVNVLAPGNLAVAPRTGDALLVWNESRVADQDLGIHVRVRRFD
jgi:hypothetical protein